MGARAAIPDTFLGMRTPKTLTSLLVLGVCAAGIAIVPGSSAAQPQAVAAMSRPAVGEPPAKPLTSSENMVKAPAPQGSVGAAGAGGGYVFVPVNPYRTLDSRAYADGYMVAPDRWHFDVVTNFANVPMIPNTAVAVTYNLTVAATYGHGYCALYPANLGWPGNSSINWTGTDQTIANGGTVAIGYLDAPGQVEIFCDSTGGAAATDFILDITGYYI